MASPPTMSDGRASAWADLPPHDIPQLIVNSKRDGWRQALDHVVLRAPTFADRMRNLGLGNWHLLVADQACGRALDIGSGFGSLVLGLSHSFDMAIGLEYLSDRLAYASMRANQDQCIGAQFTRGNGLHLPFRDSTFDLATMNGVLEWAGLYESHEPPEALQTRMLREAQRVVKPHGHVAVTIENRFALESLLAMQDTHTGLQLVTAMPRWAADVVTRVRMGEAYRTYLYSHAGYRRLFRAAGFPDVRVLDLVSSYNDYDFVVTTEDVASYRFLYVHGLVRPFFRPAGRVRSWLSRTVPSTLGRLSYAYLLLGGRDISVILDASHPIWSDVDDWQLDVGTARFACQGTTVGSMAIVTHDGGRPRAVLEVGSAITAEENAPTVLPERVTDTYASHLHFVGFKHFKGLGVRGYRVTTPNSGSTT